MLSVVVPVYNEEFVIGRCLDRLTAQGPAVDEIIVVDNGSSDGTVDVVERYARMDSRVRLVEESRRGVANARNAGFEAAKNDLIGRIDADTLVEDGWADIVVEHFERNGRISAVTGMATYHDSPIGYFRRIAVAALIRAKLLGGPVCNLYGANMAIRKAAWKSVAARASTRSDLHEDVDLALAMFQSGHAIEQLTQLNVTVSSRRRGMSPSGMWHYQMRAIDTMRNQGWTITRPILACMVGVQFMHTLQWPLYRNWDFDRRRFTFRRRDARQSPVFESPATLAA